MISYAFQGPRRHGGGGFLCGSDHFSEFIEYGLGRRVSRARKCSCNFAEEGFLRPCLKGMKVNAGEMGGVFSVCYGTRIMIFCVFLGKVSEERRRSGKSRDDIRIETLLEERNKLMPDTVACVTCIGVARV